MNIYHFKHALSSNPKPKYLTYLNHIPIVIKEHKIAIFLLDFSQINDRKLKRKIVVENTASSKRFINLLLSRSSA